eukprot:10203587-Alexandrium_andersonii.AAC.1
MSTRQCDLPDVNSNELFVSTQPSLHSECSRTPTLAASGRKLCCAMAPKGKQGAKNKLSSLLEFVKDEAVEPAGGEGVGLGEDEDDQGFLELKPNEGEKGKAKAVMKKPTIALKRPASAVLFKKPSQGEQGKEEAEEEQEEDEEKGSQQRDRMKSRKLQA